MRSRFSIVAVCLIALGAALVAQEKVDFEMLANERDSLGLALFSLDYFVDSPLKEESRAVEKPQTGDVIARRESGMMARTF